MYSGESGSLQEPGGFHLRDQELAARAVVEFFGPDSRYPAHNAHMLDNLKAFGPDTPGMEMAIYVHDIVDRLTYPKDEETRARAQSVLTELYKKAEDKQTIVYAIGCSISASRCEATITEEWREEVAELFKDRPEHERNQLAAAADPERAKHVEIDTALLKSAGVRRLNTSALLRAMVGEDYEAWPLNMYQFLHNIENPPKSNVPSTHRDCIEVLTAIAPALSLYGMTELASEGRGKAYEFYYEDPDIREKAKQQNQLSTTYIDVLEDTVIDTAIEGAITDLEEEGIFDELIDKKQATREQIASLRANIFANKSSRVKRIGSICKKLATPKYKAAKADQVPDGIGYKRFLPDYFDDETVVAFAEAVARRIAPIDQPHPDSGLPIVKLKHVLPKEKVIEDSISKPRDSGYRSYHMVFQAETDGVQIPFELHLLRNRDEKNNTYDWAAHDVFKVGVEATEEKVKDLRIIGARVEYLQEKPYMQVLNPNRWFDILQLLPDLDTPMHRIYSVVELENARVMVPKDLAGTAAEALKDANLEGNVFFPPKFLSKAEFLELIGLVDPALPEDPQINKALELLESLKLPERIDGTSQLEGHLLPAAFHGVFMTALTGMHWSSESNPIEYLSDDATALLLHDSVEDLRKKYMHITHDYIAENFRPEVAKMVKAMTSPEHIHNQEERRGTFAKQQAAFPRALIKKLSDKFQNHTVDLIRMRYQPRLPLFRLIGVSKAEIKFIEDFYIKTRTHFSPIIDAQPMPPEYHQLHQAVMAWGDYQFKNPPPGW